MKMTTQKRVVIFFYNRNSNKITDRCLSAGTGTCPKGTKHPPHCGDTKQFQYTKHFCKKYFVH